MRRYAERSGSHERMDLDVEMQFDPRHGGEATAWLASMPAAVCVTEPELDSPGPRIRYVNPAFERLFGYSADELVGRTPRLFQGPGTDYSEFGDLRSTLARGETWSGCVVNYRRDGSPFYVTWAISPVYDDFGSVNGYISVQRDFTDSPTPPSTLNWAESLFANAPFGIYNTTADGLFSKVNLAMARIYGCASPEEFLSTFSNSVAAFNDPDHPFMPAYIERAGREAFQAEMAARGRVEGFEVLARRRDGTAFWSQEDARPIYGLDGSLRGYEGFVQDISARKRSATELEEANRRLHHMASIAQIGGWEYDVRTGRVWWDDEVRRIAAVDADYEATLEKAIGFYEPDAQPRLYQAIQNAIRTGQGWDMELPLTNMEGTRIWARVMGQAITDSDGAVNRLVGVFQNISSYKAALNELRDNVSLLNMAGRIARFGGWAMNVGEDRVYWSDAVAEIYEAEPGRVPTVEEAFAYVAEADRARLCAAVAACWSEGTAFDTEVAIVTGTGKRLWTRTAGEAVYDDHGRIIRVHGAVQDISRQKSFETELRDARDRAWAADAAKTQFLANITHELRTPLNAIIGFSDLIRQGINGGDPQAYTHYADYIFESGGHLLELVNDLLDMARIEQGGYSLAEELVDFPKLIERNLSMLRQLADEKGLTVTIEAPATLPHAVGDPRAIRQVIINLLTNAFKFTQDGGRVVIRAREDDSGLLLEVADTGVGIPNEEIERVLEPFERLDTHLSRDKQSGTGLGLGISRRLMELHGGSLTLVSAVGVGTTVTATLPPERIYRGD